MTAPHVKAKSWCDYPLTDTLALRFSKPTRLLNDATQTFEQTRQMQNVRRSFLLHEGYALADRSALWRAARRDARRRLAGVVLRDFLAHRSLRRARAQLEQAREIDSGVSVLSLVAFATAKAAAHMRKVVRK